VEKREENGKEEKRGRKKHKSSTIWLGNKLGRKTDGAESFLSRPTNFFLPKRKLEKKWWKLSIV
jgi:hypothetical protein